MEPFDQQVINDNKEIYGKIHRELLKAKSEILIATAWFTDESLFNILSARLEQGIVVEVIIADNQDNEKLDFDSLARQGASVYKIKSGGYGNMNQKFCVIDREIALHGSYNWTVNAKKHNHESIISTNHRETVNALIRNFNNIKTRIQEQGSDASSDYTLEHKEIPVVEQPLNDNAGYGKLNAGAEFEKQDAGTEFEKVLDSMIAAEVSSFDRKLLRQHGFDRCSANNGDHQVLYKAFDTLYSVFINDIDVIDDKKKRLISQIEEYKVKSKDTLEKKCVLQISALEREIAITKTNLEIKETKLSAEIETINKNIDDIKDNKIPVKEKESEELDRQIKATEQECIKPVFKWFEFIPVVILNVALSIYLFIFYSSAAYILLFSVADAKLAQAQGIQVDPPQIFSPDAIKHAFEKTTTAVIFIFLFVFIPLAFAIADRFVAAKWKGAVAVLSFIFGIIVLDGAIAYKVAQAVFEMNYLQGNVTGDWIPKMAFSDTNFYLVFVFGAFGLLLFKLAFKKLMHIFEERSPDTVYRQRQLKIKQLREEMAGHLNRIVILKEQVTTLEINIIQLKVDVKQAELELRELPIRLNQELQKKQTGLLKDLEGIDKIATIYILHIQSDNLPISIDSLKDRINVFLEGWNDCLYQEYAVAKATAKTAHAAQAATAWQAEKIDASKIDKRVKIAQNV